MNFFKLTKLLNKKCCKPISSQHLMTKQMEITYRNLYSIKRSVPYSLVYIFNVSGDDNDMRILRS